MRIIIAMLLLTLGGVAFGSGIARFNHSALDRMDKLAEFVGRGGTVIPKWTRPPKDTSRIVPSEFRCAVEIVDAAGRFQRCQG